MIRVSNSLDPDQVRRSVEPDLGPDCLQKLSADKEIKSYLVIFRYVRGPDSSSAHSSPRMPDGYPMPSDHRPSPGPHPATHQEMYRQQQQQHQQQQQQQQYVEKMRQEEAVKEARM